MQQLVRVFIELGTFCPEFQFLPGGPLRPTVVGLSPLLYPIDPTRHIVRVDQRRGRVRWGVELFENAVRPLTEDEKIALELGVERMRLMLVVASSGSPDISRTNERGFVGSTPLMPSYFFPRVLQQYASKNAAAHRL
jgi:hypothetical protein